MSTTYDGKYLSLTRHKKKGRNSCLLVLIF